MQQASRTRLQSRKDVIHLELTTVVAVFFFFRLWSKAEISQKETPKQSPLYINSQFLKQIKFERSCLHWKIY